MIVLHARSLNGLPIDSGPRARFGEIGGTIGRSEGNQLVLPDAERGISRLHARVNWREGGFYIVDSGSNPISVNGARLGAGRECALRHGDQVQIGGYLLAVSEELVQPAADPLAALFADGDTLPGVLDAAPQRTAAPTPAPVPAPAAVEAAAAPAAPADLLLEEIAFDLPAPAVPAPTPAPADAVLSWALDGPAQRRAWRIDAQGRHEVAGQPEPVRQTAALAPPLPPAAPLPRTVRMGPGAAAVPPVPPVQPVPPVPASPATPDASPDELLIAFLQGLGSPGVRVTQLNPALMRLLGELLRESTRGAIELLAARSAVKRELHAPITMIGSAENNPLKFAPTLDVALQHLLGERTPGFMPPARALRDAFDELRAHHRAVAPGMQAALAEVLARFDPAALEARLVRRSVISGLIPATRKAQLWESFQTLFAQLQAEAADDFGDLFGRSFLAAYEAELERQHNDGPPAC
jgi:FHA domain-containing protein